MRATRSRLGGEQGFTLTELLAVSLIIGILAGIGAPLLANQRTKADDASQKALARAAQEAAETYATDNDGSYATLTPAALRRTEDTIPISPSGAGAYVLSVTGASPTGYTITTAAGGSAERFSVTRAASGVVTRTCTPAAGIAGGCVNGSW